jgi:signal transduction histidine kinase
MNSKRGQPVTEAAPLPARQLHWFNLFFHLVFFGGIGVSLILHWRRPEAGTRAVDLLLLFLVGIQVGLYALMFIIPGHTQRWLKRWWLALYFAGGLTIFFIECKIDGPSFYWLVGVYLAHILALPWRLSLPGAITLFVGFFMIVFGWKRLGHFSALEWFITFGVAAAWTGLLLFLHRAIVTSTERGSLILELEAAKRELEAARQREAELATLRERERLARELHDSLGHSLVTLTVQLEAAQRLVKSDAGRTAGLIAEMQKLTRSSMEELRRSLANLRSSSLGGRPLAEALATLCAETERKTELRIECRIAEGTDQLPALVIEALWRIAQEALANVQQHANAGNVCVELIFESGEAILRVTDDGMGTPEDAELKPGHFGLRGMRERVEGLGGTFTLSATDSRGALVEARVPIIHS